MGTWMEYRTRMAEAYLECAEWADWPRDDDGDEIDAAGWAGEVFRGWKTTANRPGQTSQAEQHCGDFLELLAETWDVDDDDVIARLEAAGWDAGQAGHDLWLTRNHHGAGFWDRGRELGEELTTWAQSMGGCEIEIGGDGFARLT